MTSPMPMAPELPQLREPPRPTAPPKNRVWLHVLLFVVTVLSAFVSQLEREGITDRSAFLDSLATSPGPLLRALAFALALMSIWLTHEMGHWLAARRLGVDQSLPYFIPAPTFVGTLGAVILMRSRPPNRRVLLDVAVAGPLAGFLVALPVFAFGVWQSRSAAVTVVPGAEEFHFGRSLLVTWLESWIAGGPVDDASPLARAGWVGLFVTSLNLLPVGQLDGGHVSYALFGARHRRVGRLATAALFVLGVWTTFFTDAGAGGAVWLFWAMLLLVLGTRHPPVVDEALPLARRHRGLGWLAFVLFVVTFIPVPWIPVAPPPVETPTYEPRPGPPRLPELPPLDHPPEEFKL